MINLKLNEKVRKSNIDRCREKNIILPTFAQMKDPSLIPDSIKDRLKKTGLWDIDPVNLFRITWQNQPAETGGTYDGVNYIELPSELTGVKARVLCLVGKWFPTGAHKVGATYGCLAPSLVSGNYDSQNQKAVWPSTGNYCRGGAYNSELLGCDSIAILPEEMSAERFAWLKKVAGEVIATPGCESNVKEIFDKCNELKRDRGDDIVIFNQFDEFGNYLWHYEVTGKAILDMINKEVKDPSRFKGYLSSTGSGGTIAAGDFLKQQFPHMKIGGAEALQCPTLLRNGFGGHRIEGIGDKHIPWVHNVKNTDMVLSIDDNDCMDIMRLFNEETGREYLKKNGVAPEVVDQLGLLGISGIGNLLSAIKFAKYYELEEEDVVVTILTDSMDLYGSRLKEMHEEYGQLTTEDAARIKFARLDNQKIDNALELSYYDKLRIHNLKYYTWIEQQGSSMDELNAQWYDRDYWTNIQKLTPEIDKQIEAFNKEVGL
ncbi:MAG: pyridoxal-phosphate dependent enzyme [Spirochaetales bacterium]|nr:pyridoxal-phosphate dependent enzyme [Spirochaetales bacterium]